MRKIVLSAAIVSAGVACSDGDKRKFGLIDEKVETRTVEVSKPVDAVDNSELEACRADLGKAHVLAESLTKEIETKNGSLAAAASEFDKYKTVFNEGALEEAKTAAREAMLRTITAELMTKTPSLPGGDYNDQLLKSAADEIRQAFESDPTLLGELTDNALATYQASKLKAISLAYYEANKDLGAVVSILQGTEVKGIISGEMSALLKSLESRMSQSNGKVDAAFIAGAKSDFDAVWNRLLGDARILDAASKFKPANLNSDELEGAASALLSELMSIGRGSRAFGKVQSVRDNTIATVGAEIYKRTLNEWLASR